MGNGRGKTDSCCRDRWRDGRKEKKRGARRIAGVMGGRKEGCRAVALKRCGRRIEKTMEGEGEQKMNNTGMYTKKSAHTRKQLKKEHRKNEKYGKTERKGVKENVEQQKGELIKSDKQKKRSRPRK